ncbi:MULTISPECIES: hypothetical protein [Pseudomonas]|jgi:hypothetical protein|uniref:hypothetical protein n=1 Tax=Pseudomonas TaxID=286 RepID=UPI000B352DFA|nr:MULTISPECIES: hypothetical protein [Pseudomonas]PMY49124.1 DNA-packaging protein [Pseudomonas sp. FW305-53]PMY85659.1 DNA-packaging protein [Pseudomonas sp. FW303-C2]PMY92865.1 DNA-packaging protein [Pseudomonas sp. FW305-62]PNA44378.1 DNA-packaging protein [Pseudomonas sp. FW306-2-2C-A10BC]PNA83039.1 DNA-packaging protein [Pseudomonas sp. MPR-R3B]
MNPIVRTLVPAVLAAAVAGLFLWTMHLNYLDGYSAGFDKAQADGNVAISDLKAKHADELTAQALAAKRAAEAASQQLMSEVNRGNDLAKQLADQKAELRRTTENLTKEIANVTTNYRRALDAQLEPLPPAVFTNGFIRVWNSALGVAGAATVHASTGASGVTASAGGTGAADSLDSGLGQAALLLNHNRNSERAAACRAQLNSLIEWNTHGRN